MIAVLDYGIGNLRSAEKALQHLGADAALVADPEAAAGAAGVVLPGVGSFGRCMEALRRRGLDRVVHEAVASGRPFIGICVGMQMLYEGSDESPGVPGLGVLPGRVRRLPAGVKRPQMQWNRLVLNQPTHPMVQALGPEPWVYFVHSYAPPDRERRGGHLRVRGDGGGGRGPGPGYGPPNSIRKNRARWAWPCCATSSPRWRGRRARRQARAVRDPAALRPCPGRLGLRRTPAPSEPTMDLYPAIDLRGGRCVRLVEGDFTRETAYSDDPVAVACAFQAAGARWIHVVDLDGARTGLPVNREVVGRIAAAVGGGGVRVQAGGGVRNADDADELRAAGVARVVLGTAAVERPHLVAEIAGRWPGGVAVGLDHRDGEVRVRGWTEGGGRQVAEVVPEAIGAGAVAVIVTDIARDGRLLGPDLEGLSDLLADTGAPIIASGGVRDLADVRALARLRAAGGRALAGVIAGKAIYEGALDVGAALAECSAAAG